MFAIKHPRFCYISPQSHVNLMVRNRRPTAPTRPRDPHPEGCLFNIDKVEILSVPVRLQPDVGLVNCLVSVLSAPDGDTTEPPANDETTAKRRSAYLHFLNSTLQLSDSDSLHEARVSLYDLQTYSDILMIPCIVMVKADCDLDSQVEFYDIYFRRNARTTRPRDMRLML